MKRKVLALLVPALLAMGTAHAAEIYNKDGNKLDLFGKVDARHTFSDNPGDDGDGTYIELGFKGETQISNDLTGYGMWNYKLMANSVESDNTSYNKLAFAGLKYGDYGSFDYGRNYGVIYDVEAWTDMLPVFGGDSYTYHDNYMIGRGNGMATYRNTDFFGLVEGWNFALQYQGNNEGEGQGNEGAGVGHNSLASQNGDGFGISTTYDFGMGFAASAAYSSADRTTAQANAGRGKSAYAGGERADAWAAGLKYDANNLYLAATFAETRNMTPYGSSDSRLGGGIADKTQNIEVVAQYQFDFGLRPSLAFLQSKAKDVWYDGRYFNKDLVKYADVGASWYLNKNFLTYVDYKINLLEEEDNFYRNNGIATDDIVGVGMVYQF
ncbi:porin OmpC [Franconibacter pulveris 1160]|uniref:porin OmpC n=1 Tax=Franconibacter TaxID=1649295 RepID=UPI00046515FA|nr:MULTISPECIES: porin OmpC [Franconibacter]MEB5924145.1 porin OmpC [Franconibacter daqui]